MPFVLRVLALAFHAIENRFLVAPRDLDVIRVVGAELEQILDAVVVGAFAQIVDQRFLDRDDGGPRRVARIHRVVVGLSADEQRRLRAAGVQVDGDLRLVEAVFPEIGGVGLVRDDRFHLRALHASDEAFDRSEVGLGLNRFHDLPVAAVFREIDRLAVRHDVQRIDLVAVDRDQLLHPEVERLLVERRFLERRDEEDLLLVVPLREEIRAGRRLLADQQLAVILGAAGLEVDLDARIGQTVVVEARRIFVDDAGDLDRAESGGDAVHLRCVRLGGDRLDNLPLAAALFQRRRVAGRRRHFQILDLVGFDGAEHLLLVRGARGVGLLPRDEVDVRAEPSEHDDQRYRRFQTAHGV